MGINFSSCLKINNKIEDSHKDNDNKFFESSNLYNEQEYKITDDYYDTIDSEDDI